MGKKKSNTIIAKALKEGVYTLFKGAPNKQYNYKQVSSILDVRDEPTRKLISAILNELVGDGSLVESDRGKYKFNTRKNRFVGRIDGTQQGDAYFVSDELESDVLILNRDLNQALDGDLVSVRIKNVKGKRKVFGEVIKVVERGKSEYSGTIRLGKKFAFFIPDNPKISVDFYIDLTHINGAQNGDKVLAKIISWPKGKKNPFGSVSVVLGKPGENDAEIHSILSQYNLPVHFPEPVEMEANSVSKDIDQNELKKRTDFRDVLTFTIDPEDAKDFDDAISLRKSKNDLWEVGVHIADVSHYVKPNSLLDQEAYKRGNSVYLVDRVVPMLPEVLSNGLCSLRPNEEKYAFSAVFELSEHGKISKEWFGKTVILSNRRFTYAEAQERIESGNGDLAEEVLVLDKIAKALRKKRINNGALEIETEETKFKLDENGHPVEVYQKVSLDANKLIEELMLLANKRVAEFMGKPKDKERVGPFVYRIHDKPSEDRLNDLKVYLERFDYRLELQKNKPASFAINKLLSDAKKKGDHALISPMAIKSMAKAIYSPENIGHYGLGFSYYSHFTSPIRRYADLLVHRMLFDKLNGSPSSNGKIVDSQCKHISGMEKQAVDAERASIKFMQVKYMLDKVGEVFPGKISGVTEWGIFVELHDSKCEGLVHIRSLTDDHYYFDSEKLQLVGKRYRETFGLGDDVLVEVADANLFKRQLDFLLVNG